MLSAWLAVVSLSRYLLSGRVKNFRDLSLLRIFDLEVRPHDPARCSRALIHRSPAVLIDAARCSPARPTASPAAVPPRVLPGAAPPRSPPAAHDVAPRGGAGSSAAGAPAAGTTHSDRSPLSIGLLGPTPDIAAARADVIHSGIGIAGSPGSGAGPGASGQLVVVTARSGQAQAADDVRARGRRSGRSYPAATLDRCWRGGPSGPVASGPQSVHRSHPARPLPARRRGHLRASAAAPRAAAPAVILKPTRP